MLLTADLVDLPGQQESHVAHGLRRPVQQGPHEGQKAARHGLQDKKDTEYCDEQADKLFQKTLHVVN
jgi:hypothetical protein